VADRVLIVEDNEALRVGIRLALDEAGYAVQEASSGEEAIRKLETEPCHVVVTDIRLGDLSGVDILKKAKEVNSEIEVILMTAYATVETAVQALRLGAFDYIQKPFEIEHLLHRVRTALRMGRMRGEIEFYQKVEYRNALGDDALVAESKGMREILGIIKKVAPTPATVLITGETGTGKELVARAIHNHSERSAETFVAINCAAIPEALLESELFGYEKGAFTGADSQRTGRFEKAQKGTLFLDEIGELSLSLQTKLLRFLQEHKIERIGGRQLIDLDVRVLAATNRNLKEAVSSGGFRDDLYFRLAVVTLEVPPLRDRGKDIQLIATAALKQFNREFRRSIKGFTPEAIEAMKTYAWPGNVRELENTMERAVLVCDGNVIHGHHLPPTLQSAEASGTVTRVALGEAVASYEKDLIQDALKTTRGNRAKAARLLSATERIINYKIKILGIEMPRRRMFAAS